MPQETARSRRQKTETQQSIRRKLAVGGKLSSRRDTPVRDIEVVVLKNRFGPTGVSLYFEYEPKYDTFMASTLDRYNKHKKQLGLMNVEDDDVDEE